MNTAIAWIGGIVLWLAFCWIVARFMRMNGDVEPDTQAAIDSVRAALADEQHPHPRVRAITEPR